MTNHMTDHNLTPLIMHVKLGEITLESGTSSKKDGNIQVKDQKIIVYDPIDGGKSPVISCSPLYAYFHLLSRERYAWRLIDTEPMQQIMITAEENKNNVLETIHLGDVVTQLEKMSIQSNLDIASHSIRASAS